MKCALVTGGSRGIGKAICYKLAQMGYYVLVNYLTNQSEAEKTLAVIKEMGANGEILRFDVGNKKDATYAINQWMDANSDKSVEILVNNAGIKDDVLMVWMEDEQWDSVIKTSLYGFYNVTKAVLNGMLLKKYGRIINVVSLSGLKGLPGQINYSAAKAGVIGATKALSQEVGRKGITVNAVAPGFIRTEMTDGLDEKELKALIPVRRFGTVEEVAHAVGFLASADASYITGQVLSVNGGLY
jgi:3-oxoacyl-[acyl-carrier protein] reductase